MLDKNFMSVDLVKVNQRGFVGVSSQTIGDELLFYVRSLSNKHR